MKKLNSLAFAFSLFAGIASMSAVFVPSAAQAIPVTVEFTASDIPAQAVTTGPITGSFTYEADSLTAPITSLLSIDLTIGGHVYSLAEVGFKHYISSATQVIFGLIGSSSAGAFSNDFALIFNRLTPDVGAQFHFAVPSDYIFDAGSVEVSLSADAPVTSVPEPSTLALLGFGLLGLAGYNRRRRQRA